MKVSNKDYTRMEQVVEENLAFMRDSKATNGLVKLISNSSDKIAVFHFQYAPLDGKIWNFSEDAKIVHGCLSGRIEMDLSVPRVIRSLGEPVAEAMYVLAKSFREYDKFIQGNSTFVESPMDSKQTKRNTYGD